MVWAGVAAAVLSLVCPAARAAVRPGAASTAYLDRGRVVTATRMGPAPSGRTLVAIDTASRRFTAEVARGAVVELAPGAEALLPRLGVRLVRWLMPSAGLALVEGAPGEDGLDLAARLAATRRAAASPRGAAPATGGRANQHSLAGSGSPVDNALLAGAVLQAVPDLYLRRVRASIPPDDPRYGGQWYMKRIDVESAWRITMGEPSVTVVVIDNGCDLAHEDLSAGMLAGLDVVDNDDDPSYAPGARGNEHGTACAGIIGARADNGLGIAGVCPHCTLRCVRLLTPDDGAVPISADVRAFQFVIDTGAAVVSNSWGFGERITVPGPLRTAIEKVVDEGRDGKGALVVFAAGNDDRVLGDEEITAVRGVISVGALNVFDEAASFSNHGPSLTLTAPAGTVTTDITGAEGEDPGNYTAHFGGTSSAGPVVAGAAALLVAAAPDETGERLRSALVRTARPAPYAVPDDGGHDDTYGYGIVDPAGAMRDVLGLPADGGPLDGGMTDGGTTAPPTDGGVTAAAPKSGGCAVGGDPQSSALVALGLLALLGGLRRRRRRDEGPRGLPPR